MKKIASRRHFWRFVITVLASLWRMGYAGTVHEQLPPPDFNGALFISSTINGIGEIPGFRVADDFQSTLDSNIDQVQWWGDSPPRTNDFTFAFYADRGGLPGTLLLSTRGHGLISTQASPSFRHRAYTAVLDTTFAVTSGTKYWFSVFDQGPQSQWGWLTATNDYGTNHAFTVAPPGNSWAIDDNPMAYRLTTSIPEPTTVVLFGMATVMGALV